MQVRSLGQEDPLEEEIATHSSIVAWRISRTEEPDALQSMASERVRRDRAIEPRTHSEIKDWSPRVSLVI